MTGPTPGPWHAAPAWRTLPDGRAAEGPSFAVIGGGDGCIVATAWGHHLGRAEAEANARLMAAGPALQAACRSAVRHARAPDGGGILIRQEDYMAMREAIEKVDEGDVR